MRFVSFDVSDMRAQGLSDLITENEDGVSVMTYMRSLYPLDWLNFLVHSHRHL